MQVHPPTLVRALSLSLALAAGLSAPAAFAQGRLEPPRSYRVSALELEYALDHTAHPPLGALLGLEVDFRPTRGGYVEPHSSVPSVRFALGAIPDRARFFARGLQHLNREIVTWFNERGIGGVLVTLPDIEEGSGDDLRRQDDTALRVRIWTGRVTRLGSFADGERWEDLDGESRTNHPAHAWIRADSPVTAGGPRGLLRVDAVEDYAFRLSRHPGRRVDAELRPGALPGTTHLDYRVSEGKPWLVYGQYENTGTDETTRNRQRLGFVHHQVSGHDDVLRLDYVTGDFDEVHQFYGSYALPVPLPEPLPLRDLRLELRGSWSRYDASEVGITRADFQGEQWDAGGELSLEVFQHRELFVDVLAGARWQHLSSDDGLPGGVTGSTDLFPTTLGLRAERLATTTSLFASLRVERNWSGVAGTSRGDLRELGRLDADPDFTRLHWDAAFSFYLEPFVNRRAWHDPATPGSSTLAHELELSFRGQYSFGKRLPAQLQYVAGGLHTVRGYEQSVVAGDRALVGSVEYRLHLPRLFLPDPHPVQIPVLGELRTRPQYVYGRPDWDLILRAFGDLAQLAKSDALDFEDDETLLGAGFGLELQLLRHFRARVDLGFPLSSLESSDSADDPTPEIHTSITVLY